MTENVKPNTGDLVRGTIISPRLSENSLARPYILKVRTWNKKTLTRPSCHRQPMQYLEDNRRDVLELSGTNDQMSSSIRGHLEWSRCKTYADSIQLGVAVYRNYIGNGER